MTYCIGILVNEGLVMFADTRTNAGVDNVSTYRKLRAIDGPQGACIALASAGSLSTTQAALFALGGPVRVAGEAEPVHLSDSLTMFRVAQVVGQALKDSKREVDAVVASEEVQTGSTLLVGGALPGQPVELFLVYGEGNFIACGRDTPFMQIGETKYGKPILDRLLSWETPLADAFKIGLLSMNSTMRSNVAVGPPIDALVLRRGATKPTTHRIEERDPWYEELGHRWQAALRDAAQAIPMPPYALD